MLMRKLENEQGDLLQYREREGKAAAQKAELEAQLEENKEKMDYQSEQRVKLTYEKEGLEHEVSNIKKDVTEMEDRIAKAEAEKTSRDHAMRQLNDEIANQDEIISKLNKVRIFLSLEQLLIFCYMPINYDNDNNLRTLFGWNRKRNFSRRTITKQRKKYIRPKTRLTILTWLRTSLNLHLMI